MSVNQEVRKTHAGQDRHRENISFVWNPQGNRNIGRNKNMRREFEVEIKNIGRKEELHEMEKKDRKACYELGDGLTSLGD